jgi:Putative peptidoglycan binding domain
MKTFLSIVLAVALSTGTILAKQGGRGGHRADKASDHRKHGKHFSSQAPRGGQSKHFSSRSPRGGQSKHFSSRSPRGEQSKHFSSRSPRGGRTFSRSGSKFSRGKSIKSGNWSGRNWSGDRWHYGFSGGPFIFIGGFGYPYYWGWYPFWAWSVPYAFSYGYYSYGYYPSYGYGYGYPYYWDSYPGWAWSVPYAYNYGYDSYGDYPSYGYNYDYDSDPTYGYANRSSIAQLQSRLAQAGYYHGAIDGIMGPATRRAIRDYERDYGRVTMQ